ncbi:MAG: UDP-N-acetylmuramoyl-tripeptide--D-alanyl-D-alanine ligase [Firmicutes bacterium]|nr:UDP-N-acetylmuramoyl-tripeptide--D-alanyl-D-alanine ligase [Bacillota bacterium]
MNYINETLFFTVVIWTLGVFILAAYKRSKYFLHMMQLEEYKNNNFIKWTEKFSYKIYPRKIIINTGLTFILTVVYVISSFITKAQGIFISFIIIWSILMVFTINFKKEKVKKDLVFTPKAKRLFAFSWIVYVIDIILDIFVLRLITDNVYFYPVLLLLMTINYLLADKVMYIANILIRPIENKINRYYFDLAQDKMKSFNNLKVVGITGSVGKTTTKLITSTIINDKYKLLKTSESHNTKMEISKAINNKLSNDFEAFVVELNGRKTGYIKELAKLTNPSIGVLTAIGPSHMESVNNIENIMKTKYELIEELPADGIAIFNYDDKYIKKLADKTFKEKILFGMKDLEKLDIYATDVKVNEKGSTFILNDNEDSIKCETKLLGKHNISNLLAGAAVAKALGFSLKDISKGIKKVKPAPHRLELKDSGTEDIIIDDTFNSNLIGSKKALEIISKFERGRKIIITPGIIQLGEQEEKENKEFSKNIAKICNYSILIGEKRTKPIYDGLVKEGFNEENIFVVNSLEDAKKRLQSIVKPKDVVLFENHLPDNYKE